MADLVVDANAVKELISFVVPGFLVYTGWRAKHPSKRLPTAELLVVSVVLSLPLVALWRLLPGDQGAGDIGWVILLAAASLAVGYGLAEARGSERVVAWLAERNYTLQPSGTIWAQTLTRMSPDASITLELKGDGRRISGVARNGPQTKEDDVDALYLVYPKALAPDGTWEDIGAGFIVPISEIANVTLSEEPTGAPPPAG